MDLLAAQRAVWESDLTTTRKIVMLAILDHWSRESSSPFPSLGRLGRWTSLGRRTLSRALAVLEADCWIRVQRKAGCSNRYTITNRCHGGTSATRSLVPERHPTSATLAPPPVPLRQGSSATVAPEGTQEGTQEKEPREGTHTADELRVFSHWVETLANPILKPTRTLKPTETRLTPIRARLRDGFTSEQLCRAIDAVARSPHHRGENDAGTPYVEPKTIFRSAEKVDGWLAAKHPKPNGQAPKQKNAGHWQAPTEHLE